LNLVLAHKLLFEESSIQVLLQFLFKFIQVTKDREVFDFCGHLSEFVSNLFYRLMF